MKEVQPTSPWPRSVSDNHSSSPMIEPIPPLPPVELPLARDHYPSNAMPPYTPEPVPYNQPSAAPIRKLRLGGIAVIVAPIATYIALRVGLPAVSPDDVEAAAALGYAAYVAVGGAVTWVTSYLARPSALDAPIPER